MSFAVKPAFSASLTNSKTVSAGQIVKFDKVWTNIGSGYDPNTGVFTAPEAGVYQFACTITKYNHEIRAYLYKNEMQTVAIYPSTAGIGLEMGTMNMVLQLQKADRVYIKQTTSGQVYSESNSNFDAFSGFKISDWTYDFAKKDFKL